MARLSVDADGVFCPKCGGRQMGPRTGYRSVRCLSCGKILEPAKRSEAKKALGGK